MSEWKDLYVRVTKLSAQANPDYPTPALEEFEPGGWNKNVSLPLNYWSEGFLINEPEAGKSLLLDRRIRNGVTVEGVLQTSQVASITELPDGGLQVDTRNSTYIIKKVEQDGTFQPKTY